MKERACVSGLFSPLEPSEHISVCFGLARHRDPGPDFEPYSAHTAGSSTLPTVFCEKVVLSHFPVTVLRSECAGLIEYRCHSWPDAESPQS